MASPCPRHQRTRRRAGSAADRATRRAASRARRGGTRGRSPRAASPVDPGHAPAGGRDVVTAVIFRAALAGSRRRPCARQRRPAVDQRADHLRVGPQPLEAKGDGPPVVVPAALEQVEERHRGHCVLVHAVDGVALDDRAVADVVVPPPLARRPCSSQILAAQRFAASSASGAPTAAASLARAWIGYTWSAKQPTCARHRPRDAAGRACGKIPFAPCAARSWRLEASMTASVSPRCRAASAAVSIHETSTSAAAKHPSATSQPLEEDGLEGSRPQPRPTP